MEVSTNKTIERYQKNDKSLGQFNRKTVEQTTENLKEELATMTRKLEFLEDSKRKLLGQGLESSTLDELQQVEEQLERSLSNIRARKAHSEKQPSTSSSWSSEVHGPTSPQPCQESCTVCFLPRSLIPGPTSSSDLYGPGDRLLAIP
ncbi:hypothetical protein HAX54_015027 [Datura stramonium]|uniref:K-box domain-containing protein n=1 Tax=Datura stramonium TaxID=4076 RepID=A0ABS8RZ46_DATST|nr:hypothetical protein [Datura stramonium]